MTRHSTVFLAAFLSFTTAIGCASTPYVSINDLPEDTAGREYLIATGDVLSVRVFNQENMSTRAKVRSDGKIAVPLLGDVVVRNRTPSEVSKELEAKFKTYVVSPVVTLTVEESQPTSVSVLGEVTKPGIYTMDSTSGVLQALAAAGGLTEYASYSSIYVVRREPSERIRFTFADLTAAGSRASAFRLRPGDVVVVE